MDETKYSNATLEHLQEERKHLETLFADRINFYLVFAAGVLAFLFDEKHPKVLEIPALLSVTAVSILMLFALWRTYRLVMCILEELLTKHARSPIPYAFYYRRATRVPNANRFLLALPFSLTLFFVYALVQSIRGKF